MDPQPNKVLKEDGLTEALRLVKIELDKKIEDADLPTKTSDLLNDGSDGSSTYMEAADLALVATTNDYEDLDNKPEEITPSEVDAIWQSLNGESS